MSSQQKNSILILGFFLALVLVYVFAIQKTLQYKEQSVILQKEKKLLDNASENIRYLQQKNAHLDTVLQANNLSINSSFQQALLQKIGDFIQKEKTLQLVHFKEPHLYTNEAATQKVYAFTIRGNFSNLLQFLHYLEQERLGALISVNFERKKNYTTGKLRLELTVFLRKMIE